MKQAPITRRDFLHTVSMVGIATFAAGNITGIAGAGNVPVTKKTSEPMHPLVLDLNEPENTELKKIGGALKIGNPLDKNRPVIVTRVSEKEYAAFSSRCTHTGCEVSLPENSIIECKCHKSRFDLRGKVTGGPAKKDLSQFATKLDGATLTITGT